LVIFIPGKPVYFLSGVKTISRAKDSAKAISIWETAGIYLKSRSHQESDKRGVMTGFRSGRDTEILDKPSRRKTETAEIKR